MASLTSQLVWDHGAGATDDGRPVVGSKDPNTNPRAHLANVLTPVPILSVLKYIHLPNPAALLRSEVLFNVLFYRCFNNNPLVCFVVNSRDLSKKISGNIRTGKAACPRSLS